MKIKKILKLGLATLLVATTVSGVSALATNTVSAATAEWATGNANVTATSNYDITNSEYGMNGMGFAVTETDNATLTTYNDALKAEGFWYKDSYLNLKPMFYETKAEATDYSINLGSYNGDFGITFTPVQSVVADSTSGHDYFGVEFTFTNTETNDYFTWQMYNAKSSRNYITCKLLINTADATKYINTMDAYWAKYTNYSFLGRGSGRILNLMNVKYDQDEHAIKFGPELENQTISLSDSTTLGESALSAFENYTVTMKFYSVQAGKTAKLCVYNLNGKDLTSETNVEYPAGGVIINKARLNLEGKIGVQFLVSADESLYDANGGKVVFTVAGETQEVAFKDWTASGDDYIVECEVAAKQMTDTITVQFVDKNGAVSTQTTYSVAEYANAILAGEDQAAKELVKATLNYGAYAQIYFGYNTENLANAGLYEAGQNPVELKTTVTAATATVSGALDGVSMKSLALGLETETEIYVLFTLTDVALADVTFKVDGETVKAVADTNGGYIVIKNVAAKDVDKEYTVTATYGENTVTYTVSAQCYISAAFGQSENAAYNDLLKAIELYNVAANAYFA